VKAPGEVIDARFVGRVILKTLALLAAFNLAFALLQPLPLLGRFSAYNGLFPGRTRFPFGENPEKSYNLSLYSVEAMFAAHALAGAPKAPDEYRVFVLGDSSAWGTLLRPAETLAGQLDALHLERCGKTVRFYNLGYPTLSVLKDLMLLQEAKAYAPDLVLWPLTLQSLPYAKQLASPLVANNPARVDDLLARWPSIRLDPGDPQLARPDFWQRTFFGQRRALSDLLRFQAYGVPWAATGIDQEYPADYPPAQRDLEADESFMDFEPHDLPAEGLAWEVIAAGVEAAAPAPVWLINEPMLVSTGKNSEIRYNFFYPRWAYDRFREMLVERSAMEGWTLLDLWDLVPQAEFTNSAIHLSPAGSIRLAERVADALGGASCPIDE